MSRRTLLLFFAVVFPAVVLDVGVSGGVALAFVLGALFVYPTRAHHGVTVALLTAAALGPVVALASSVDTTSGSLALVVGVAAGISGYGARWGHDTALVLVPILAVVFSAQVTVPFALAEGAGLFLGAAWGAVLLHGAAAATPGDTQQVLSSPLAVLYGGLLAVSVGASTYVAADLDLAHGYWVPMTILLVARPSVSGAWSMALARSAGTVLGVVVAVGVAMALPWSEVVVAAGVVALFAGMVVVHDQVTKSTAITVGVILLMTGAAPADATAATALERLELTLAGAVTVVAFCVLVPRLLHRLGGPVGSATAATAATNPEGES